MLRREKERGTDTAAAPDPGRPRRSGSPSYAALPGWENAAELVLRQETELPLSEDFLRDLAAASDFFAGGAALEKLLWYDTETTGLSGGAGTTAFLFGSARVDGSVLRLSQLFLADFPGEPELLSLAADRFADGPILLSYNGRAFDGPLLRGRFIMNRMAVRLPDQFDLLFTARRLWRGVLSDCSLGTVEREVLGRTRTDDIPGALIPAEYFNYLAGRGTEAMLRVAYHNREDILSLVHLFAHLGRLVDGRAPPDGVDPEGFGIMLCGRFPERGIPLLRRAAEEGGLRALRWLSRYYKTRGLWTEAESLWRRAARAGGFARLELAKLREHRLRDYEGALALTEELLREGPPRGWEEALQRRRDRLLGKIRRAGPEA